MNLQRVKSVLYWAGLVIGLGLLAYQLVVGLLSFRQPGDVSDGRMWYLVGVLLAMLGVVLIQMINWHILLRGLGVKIPFKDICKGYVYSFLPRYIPGSVWGYLSRSEWLHRTYRVPYHLTNTASILEIGVTLVSGCMLIGLAIPAHMGLAWIRQAAYALLLPAAVWFLLQRSGTMLRTKKGRRQVFGEMIMKLPLVTWALLILIYLGQWILLGAATLMGAAAFAPVSLSAWIPASAIFSLSWMAGFFIIFVPGGLGVRELVLTSLLMGFLGSTEGQGALTAVALRVLYSAAELLWLGWAGVNQVIGGWKPNK